MAVLKQSSMHDDASVPGTWGKDGRVDEAMFPIWRTLGMARRRRRRQLDARIIRDLDVTRYLWQDTGLEIGELRLSCELHQYISEDTRC